ncbi:MAG TPA: iron-containing alcohol dehydrogenase [Ohtaekwangia sp.]|uniref:iron-containing alcohol dehydrogenase n=1 Tax=Ohtaekwangia sp. TaxID=2066019 RepID=UPI002F92389A
MTNAFALAHIPSLHFGAGKISVLPSVVKAFGKKVLLITGAHSFTSSPYSTRMLEQLQSAGYILRQHAIGTEPTPAMIDDAVNLFADYIPNVVVAIGGGSVLDAGKAIAAMLPLREPVKDYLEGVGTKNHPGVKIPFIAIPTTAGTGSEATKNAVLSETGISGYKKSLRHANFVPDAAIIDPQLTLSCSPAVTAASGMDAFTQLLESYLSTAANPITDALAYEGLKQVAGSLPQVYRDGSNLAARTAMALASYLSGITLANAGLGLVHGFASSVGGYFTIPHGVICSSLMAPANTLTVQKLRATHQNPEALAKYTLVGKLFTTTPDKPDEYYIDALLSLIEQWTYELNIPRLSHGGVTTTDLEKIVLASDNKNNPIALDQDEMVRVLEMAL